MEFSISPQTCRVCLKKALNGRLLSDLYTATLLSNAKDSKNKSYWDIYKIVVPLQNNQHTTVDASFIPKCICDNCEAQLIVTYEFLRKSKRSEKILHHILNLYEEESQDMNNKVKDEPCLELVEESIAEFCERDNYDEINDYRERLVNEQNHSDNAPDPIIMTYHESTENEFFMRTDNTKDDQKSKEIENEFMDTPQESDTNDEGEDVYAMELQEPKPKTSQCIDCGKMVSSHYLVKHRETHIDKGIRRKTFECDQCKARFTLKENLNKHKRIHADEKRYTCPFCQEQFLHWASRRYHIASHHTGEKRYTCEYCGAKFRNSSHYSIHIRRHTGVTPYPCHLCDRSFITSNSLKVHLVSHSDSKNFHCDLCKKSYKSTKTLRLHQRTAHEHEKNYVCPLCKRAFSQNHLLRAHLSKNHPEYEPPPPGTVVNMRAVEKINEKLKRTGSD
ncbi:zinc finger protein 624-like isoform X2 [Wyeomyia smithii]|nr:zinc finger protein 624-like isoform X2 [Wyeomyia smithii]